MYLYHFTMRKADGWGQFKEEAHVRQGNEKCLQYCQNK